MTPDQFSQFLISNEEATGRAIELHVNGKIRSMTAKLDAHIERVEPVIKAYEDSKVIEEKVAKAGEKTIFYGKIVTAVGVLFAGFAYSITHIKV